MVNIVNSLLASALQIPQGLGVWEDIIRWFYGFIGDYGWTVVLITVIIKLLMLPLDYFQRRSTAKMQAQQERIRPQLEKLQEKYKDDKNTLNQKTMELYKRENVGMFGSCGIMLLYMAITVFVFITLFFGMNNISRNAVEQQYNELKATYDSVQQVDGQTQEEFELARNQAVLDKYNEIKTSFLWIENIWRPDRTVSPIATFEEYANAEGISSNDENYEQLKAEYEQVMTPLRESVGNNNGYYVLIILAAVVTFISLWLSNHVAKKGKKDKKPEDQGRIVSAKGEREKPSTQPQGAIAQKVLMWVLPIVMLFITWGYSAAFALYVVTTSACGAIINFVIGLILNKKKDDFAKPDNNKKTQVKKPDYVRQ